MDLGDSTDVEIDSKDFVKTETQQLLAEGEFLALCSAAVVCPYKMR